MDKYFMETHHHEWILTNRLGSYAMGTGNLINQRKYHGLLIAGDRNFNRHHLVAGIEERVEWRGDSFFMDSNNYSNCIYPEGFLHLVKPWLRPYPAFLYSALPHQNEILIFKEIMMDEQTNTVLLRYTNLGEHKLHLELLPKFTLCMHHELNSPGTLDHEHFALDIQASEAAEHFQIVRVKNNLKVFGYLAHGEIHEKRSIYREVFYPWEVMVGYEGIGDQLALVQAKFDLKPLQANYLLFSDSPIKQPNLVIERILARYQDLPKPVDYPDLQKATPDLLGDLDYEDNILFKRADYMKILEFALTDFIANNDIIAGFPFYGAWGRDTMVVLNALLHSQKHQDLVEKTLIKYSRYIKNGLIPNRFAESGNIANYDSLDATFLYIILLWKLGKKKQDKSFWQEAICLSERILTAIKNNSDGRYWLRKDALIELSESFAHGTWMDVRIAGDAITPRSGAPVEINALWYNAIASYEAMLKEFQAAGYNDYLLNKELIALKEQVQKSFMKFYRMDYLADRLLDDTPVMQIRPNALIALSLPHQIVEKKIMKEVFERAFRELYTFYGIRSLSPQDPAFRKKYLGTQAERDLAYHNGSAWAWLLGPFTGLYLKVYKDEKTPQEIAKALGDFISTLRNGFMRGHIASVAEVWDGDQPHFPKGAPAQAWSVAALYNIESFIDSLEVEQ